jgi:hypothetical protein
VLAVVQHARLPFHSPLEKTLHNTGVESWALVAAPIALLQVAPERRRAAALEGAHDAALRRAERSAVRLTIGFAVAAKHLRHFELRPIHGPALEVRWWGGLGLHRRGLRQQVERAFGGAHLGGGDAQVAGRGGQAAMTQQ